MRHTTKNVETAVNQAAEADNRLATRIATLRSWVANVSRHVDERRNQTVAEINTAADALMGELTGLDGELAAVHDELTGEQNGHQPVPVGFSPTLERLLAHSDVVLDMTKAKAG